MAKVKCDKCEKEFTRKWNYDRHLRNKNTCDDRQKQIMINIIIEEIKELLLINYYRKKELTYKDKKILKAIITEKKNKR